MTVQNLKLSLGLRFDVIQLLAFFQFAFSLICTVITFFSIGNFFNL